MATISKVIIYSEITFTCTTLDKKLMTRSNQWHEINDALL